MSRHDGDSLCHLIVNCLFLWHLYSVNFGHFFETNNRFVDLDFIGDTLLDLHFNWYLEVFGNFNS